MPAMLPLDSSSSVTLVWLALFVSMVGSAWPYPRTDASSGPHPGKVRSQLSPSGGHGWSSSSFLAAPTAPAFPMSTAGERIATALPTALDDGEAGTPQRLALWVSRIGGLYGP